MTTACRRSSGTSRSFGALLFHPAPCVTFRTFCAAAAHGFDEQLEIFRSVVVGNLLARFDRSDRAQDHLALYNRALGIRPAGMVGIAADVAARRAVDGPAAVDLEHVAGALRLLARLRLARRNALAGIFDDEGATPDRCGGEQAEPGRRAADAVVGAWRVPHAAASRASVVCSGKQLQTLTIGFLPISRAAPRRWRLAALPGAARTAVARCRRGSSLSAAATDRVPRYRTGPR